jgi:membrane-bound lytic murein transglycosylase B
MQVRWCAVLMVALAMVATAVDARSKPKKKARSVPAPRHVQMVDGRWDYLIDKLVADGVPRSRAQAAFDDPLVGPFEGLSFSLLRGGERSTMYRGFLRPASIADAQRCRALYDSEFRAAEARFGVPAAVVGALLHVETHCGRNTGRSVVFARLARLAMANEPGNVQRNIMQHTDSARAANLAAVERMVRARAREIEGTFYPEVLALFQMEERTGIAPLDIRGSGSGAFGLPQFLPSSYLRFGVDGDADGRVSLYDPADAIASAANYLARHGWRPGISHGEQRQVIWTYNHSDPYIDTVLALAAQLERAQPSQLSLAAR